MTSPAAQIIDTLDPLFDGRVASDRGDGLKLPYGVVLFPISRTVTLRGDARAQAIRNLIQVDVWQRRPDEDRDLVARVVNGLDGLSLTGGGHVSVQSGQRVLEPDFDLLHDVVTCEVTRLRGPTV